NLNAVELELLVINLALLQFDYLLFFFHDTATTEIYTLSLHDALPISSWATSTTARRHCSTPYARPTSPPVRPAASPSTSVHTRSMCTVAASHSSIRLATKP